MPQECGVCGALNKPEEMVCPQCNKPADNEHLVHYMPDGRKVTELARDRHVVLAKIEWYVRGTDGTILYVEYATWYSREVGVYSSGDYYTEASFKSGAAWLGFIRRWNKEKSYDET